MLELLAYIWIVPLLALIVGYKFTLRFLFGMIIIPNNNIGVVNKKFVLLGSNRTLPDGKIIALKGEAGWQVDTLAPGLKWGYWPWQYKINLQPFINIKDNQLGVVEAMDGTPLSGGRVLGKKVNCDSFQDARAFLNNGGERGPQITIIPPGTYRINTALFHISLGDVKEIRNNMVGLVTTKEGKELPKGATAGRGVIAGKVVPGHNSFQDAQSFLDNGGFKGRQEQVILAGRYFLNPWFVSVEEVEMTTVPIASVGVIISYVGDDGKDVTGDAFKHGNLVKEGEKGVWVEPIDPGKYPINTYTHKLENVPTANVVLNWATGKTESHKAG